MIEAIFGALVKHLTAEPLYHSFRRGFVAMVDQEVETTEMGKPMSAIFKRALSHLRMAASEPQSSPAEQQHVEDARRAFAEAVQLDTSLVAARAAVYAGFCHRLLEEPQDLSWYERSLEMISAIEARTDRKAMDPSSCLAGTMARSDSPILDLPALFAITCRRCLENTLRAQQQTVREHKQAVAAIGKVAQRARQLKEARAQRHLPAREQKPRSASYR